VLLLVAAAGALAFAGGAFQEASVIPAADDVAFDVSATLPEDADVGALLRALVGYTAAPTVLRVVVWLAYRVVTAALFLHPSTRAAPARRASDAQRHPSDSTVPQEC
jgi:high-affinity iron transporter